MIQIGKTYKTNNGREIQITEKLGVLGEIYLGVSIDNQEPNLCERYEVDGKWWSYISSFSMLGPRILRNEELNLILK